MLSKRDHWAYASFNYLPHPRLSQVWKYFEPSVIHLHWIGDGFVPLSKLCKLPAPLVATLHGRWLFNGAQHLHNDRSPRFVEGFYPDNRDPEDGGVDVDRWVWNRKHKAFKDLQMNIVTLSRWMERDARKSLLLGNYSVKRIPNGIDLETFLPHDRETVRRELGLPIESKIIVFGANFAIQDSNKGFNDFVEAIRLLEEKEKSFEIVVFGSDRPEGGLPFKSKIHFKGFVRDENELSKIYAAADVFVLPSKQDNLPNTVMESLASGTPCVAYDVGGVSDMVEHDKTGYLALPGNSQSLCSMLERILEMPSEGIQMMSENARLKIENEFSIAKQVEQMIELYAQVARY